MYDPYLKNFIKLFAKNSLSIIIPFIYLVLAFFKLLFLMKDKKLNNIVDILVDELQPEKLILFGSRGKGKAEFNSDYDIAIDSGKIDLSEKRILKEKIDKIIGLHKIDLVFLMEVDSGFKNIIQKTGKIIYER